MTCPSTRRGITASAGLSVVTLLVVITAAGCKSTAPPPGKAFDTPEAAVKALTQAVAAGNLADVITIFGPEGQELVDSSDPETARRNREVFTVAVKEGWHLTDEGNRKILVVGNEEWPFPVPLAKDGGGWRFDTAAGKEEVLARRIGRNELAVIRTCRAYVAAQHRYAADGHDGQPAGIYAASFRSDAGRQNGLYWPTHAGQRRSPLGEMIQEAERRATTTGAEREPFHGYYFRILTGQGPAASGGARDYLANGHMNGGFALVAWPAHYDATGVMTFIVNQDGAVYQQDFGPETDTAVERLQRYDPDQSWSRVE